MNMACEMNERDGRKYRLLYDTKIGSCRGEVKLYQRC